MKQLQHIEAIEKRLWKAADTLRSNSELASNEYFLPVMGLIFLRHAYSRYLSAKVEIEKSLPSRGGKTRALTKEDFSGRGAIYLGESARFDSLVALSDDDDRQEAVINAMESIEKDYTGLEGQLPKLEYRSIPNDNLGNILRILNPDELLQADGDIFGRIYEYFLTQFADQGAHDGGEFFTPISLVQMIVNVIEPDHGKILDPACGSGGMFVQSAHFVERQKRNPGVELTFYGHEKNPTTTRLAKMNLRVHGLEGNIAGGVLTYYNDPHEGLWGNCDFVMANPPFNVDEVDAEKIKSDRRLPFGLPGVNKADKVSNGNYLWISYFYSYLGEKGRAGFVMSSQSSSAGGGEAAVRQELIKTGHVEAMIDIRSNFFYTRSVPCQLWFFNKAKPKGMESKVLMIDARHVYRKVTRKIYDFSPEQLANLTSIVWLYRGQNERFIELVQSHIQKAIEHACEASHAPKDKTNHKSDALPLVECIAALAEMEKAITPFYNEQTPQHKTQLKEFSETLATLASDAKAFAKSAKTAAEKYKSGAFSGAKGLSKLTAKNGMVESLAETSRNLIKDLDLVYKLATRLIETAEKELGAKGSPLYDAKKISGARESLKKTAEALRAEAVEALKLVRYFYKQADWLLVRFPEGKLADVEGLVKLVDLAELEVNDYSLTPGRYVGVAPEEEDEDFDFEETLRDIHVELAGLNEEAVALAGKIAKNFEELGI